MMKTTNRGVNILQTFLPISSFRETARSLDNRRLNKQIVECYQILRCLIGLSNGVHSWHHHPAVMMWRGFETGLYLYWDTMILEWVTVRNKNSKFYPLPILINSPLRLPSWTADERVYKSHQANLVRKYYEGINKGTWDNSVKPYPEQFPDIKPEKSYFWPEPLINDFSYRCREMQLLRILNAYR